MSTLTTYGSLFTRLANARRTIGRIIWHPGTAAASFHTVPHWIDFLNEPSHRQD
jgi:hypothetical protein